MLSPRKKKKKRKKKGVHRLEHSTQRGIPLPEKKKRGKRDKLPERSLEPANGGEGKKGKRNACDRQISKGMKSEEKGKVGGKGGGTEQHLILSFPKKGGGEKKSWPPENPSGKKHTHELRGGKKKEKGEKSTGFNDCGPRKKGEFSQPHRNCRESAVRKGKGRRGKGKHADDSPHARHS